MQIAHIDTRSKVVLVTILAFVLFLSACAEQSPSMTARASEPEECESAKQEANQMATITGVAAAKMSDARNVRAWIARHEPHTIPPEIAALNANSKVAVCAFTGSGFVTPRPPEAPDPDTAIFFVTPSGKSVLYVVGVRSNMDSLTP